MATQVSNTAAMVISHAASDPKSLQDTVEPGGIARMSSSPGLSDMAIYEILVAAPNDELHTIQGVLRQSQQIFLEWAVELQDHRHVLPKLGPWPAPVSC